MGKARKIHVTKPDTGEEKEKYKYTTP